WEIIDENGDVFMCSGTQILKLNGASGRFILRNRTSSEIPTEFTLFPAFPNPFNPSTTIGFSLGSSATATLRVYDITGKNVNTLLEHELELGHHSVQWNASGFPSGIYFIQFSTGELIETQKIVLMK
ncbi:MAG: T9SS type A sorting domain-containing protein, partial [Candidatus Marinimicrobia bacterium]|nr:T9SS type A sorting domain-containing protein [Candidatus Neomarinimicrobiota bacterium]